MLLIVMCFFLETQVNHLKKTPWRTGKNYFIKKTLRVILSGIFPVLRPCSRIYNLHEKPAGLYVHMGPEQVWMATRTAPFTSETAANTLWVSPPWIFIHPSPGQGSFSLEHQSPAEMCLKPNEIRNWERGGVNKNLTGLAKCKGDLLILKSGKSMKSMTASRLLRNKHHVLCVMYSCKVWCQAQIFILPDDGFNLVAYI